MSETSPGEITKLLRAHSDGDEQAFDRLVPLVYDELLVIARQQLARWRNRGGTIDTTGLAHEAYLKLARQFPDELEGRQHFYAIAARSMRLILVDHARARTAKKRGEGKPGVPLDNLTHEGVEAGWQREAETILAVDQALERLANVDQRLARVFECRFFGGLTVEETASSVGSSERTVLRDWLKAKAFLRRELR